MTNGQRNALILALLLTCAIAVIHASFRYADQPMSVMIGQTISWGLIPWIVSAAATATVAVWWRVRRKRGPLMGVMIWAIFVLLTAHTMFSFSVAANLPN